MSKSAYGGMVSTYHVYGEFSNSPQVSKSAYGGRVSTYDISLRRISNASFAAE